MIVGVYEVIGHRSYNGHSPGTEFEEWLDPGAEFRAVTRGDIRVLDRIEVRLPDEHELPPGWAEDMQATEGPPTGALLIEGS